MQASFQRNVLGWSGTLVAWDEGRKQYLGHAKCVLVRDTVTMTSWMSKIKWNILRFPIHGGILEFVLSFISSVKKYSNVLHSESLANSSPVPVHFCFFALALLRGVSSILCSIYLDENHGLSWVLAFNSLLKHSVASGRRQLSLTFTAAGIIQKCSGHRSTATSDEAIIWQNWYTLRAPGVCVRVGETTR